MPDMDLKLDSLGQKTEADPCRWSHSYKAQHGHSSIDILIQAGLAGGVSLVPEEVVGVVAVHLAIVCTRLKIWGNIEIHVSRVPVASTLSFFLQMQSNASEKSQLALVNWIPMLLSALA